MEKKIRQRCDIPEADRWATEDLYASDALWEEDLKKLEHLGVDLASYEGKLGSSAENLLGFMDKLEQVEVLASQVANYASRKGDEDTRVAEYQAMNGKLMSALVALNAGSSFQTPEIMAISQQTLEEFYQTQPKLERYRRYLDDMRRMKDHVLSAEQEKLLAAAGEMAQTPSNAFEMFAYADLKFPAVLDGEGESHPLSSANFTTLETSPDRTLRKNAYEALYHRLAEFQNTSAALLAAQVKQLQFFAQARKYPASLDASLDNTNVPTAVYLNLIEAVHQNMDKMHRYVRLRKKLLNVDELHFYDVYTPLISGVEKQIPFDEAKQTVYEALAPLGEGYRKILKEGFENRWIDVYENEGKRSGAYSAGARVHPYVLLNYNGTLDSQFTLAHEMGHALHSYLSNHTQNPLDADYVIFVAEVASTCNEALLMDHLLNKTTDKKERIYLINHFLEQFKSTLYRQTMFAEFELNIARMYQQGTPLTAQTLCAEYKRLNEMYFGPDMVVDDEIAMEWARIPHFYYNYYVFQYATGYSAAIALSQQILSEGESAVKRYLEFLSGGCSKSPVDLLKGAGVDMSTPAPVNQALELFGKLLDEMEELTRD